MFTGLCGIGIYFGLLGALEQVATQAKPNVVRFGNYEFAPDTQELRKAGIRIHLEGQPLAILQMLLERPGELVTRDELQKKLWPSDTFVDFEHSLNAAVKRLRAGLNDSADQPRYLETLARRGYRFIASVTSDAHEVLVLPAAPAPKGRTWKITVLAVVFIVAVGITAGLVWRGRHHPPLTERDTIVVGDFANSTGDPVFDGTLREGLSVQLEQSPFLSLVSEDGIHQTLSMMGQNSNGRLTPEVTREVCQRTNSAAALEGSIALIGSKYELILRAVNCTSGDSLAGAEAQADDKSHVLDALGKVASDMRRKLGESLNTVQKYNAPLEQATTPSLEALQVFSLGFKTLVAGNTAGSLPFFQRATQLDPKFSMAYWGMGLAYGNFGETALSIESNRKAFELRERLSEHERLTLECDYYAYDWLKARRSCDLGVQTYPRDPFFHLDLGVYANFSGQYENALREYKQALHLGPRLAYYYRNVALTYVLLNRADEAEASARDARTRGFDSDFLPPVLYGIAFYRNDAHEMARQVTSVANKPGVEDLLLAMEGDTAAYYGHLEHARELSRQAEDSAERAGEKEAAAGYSAASALRESLFGNVASARQQAALAGRRSTGRDVDYGLALALAYAGDASHAQTLADDLGKNFPEDTTVRLNYLPTIQAKIALLHSDPQAALELLRAAASYELGLPAIGFYNWPNLYPVYVRGEAYLAAHQGHEAVAEFQKILDHRGTVLNEPIGALAHLQLGRAYALQDDTAKARGAYQNFLTLWKDADPDIAVLKQAKAELAKLP